MICQTKAQSHCMAYLTPSRPRVTRASSARIPREIARDIRKYSTRIVTKGTIVLPVLDDGFTIGPIGVIDSEIGPLDGYAFNQMGGMHTMAPTFMINFHRVDDESDYLAYVSRLRALPTVLDRAIAAGLLPPGFGRVLHVGIGRGAEQRPEDDAADQDACGPLANLVPRRPHGASVELAPENQRVASRRVPPGTSPRAAG